MNHSANVLTAAFFMAVVCAPSQAQVDRLDWGGDLEFLGVYTDDTRDFGGSGDTSPRSVLGERFEAIDTTVRRDDQEDFIRMEGHLWMQALLAENVRTKFSVEFDRNFDNADAFVDVNDDRSAGGPADDDLDLFLEEAYIQVSSLFEWPWTLTVGRQFIQWGDGFVLGDALPGSPRNVADLGRHERDPFDAVRIEVELSEALLLDLLASKAAETRSVDEDMDLYGANLRYRMSDAATLEMYYLLATVDGDGLPGGGDVRAEIHQAGVRSEVQLSGELAWTGELTYQFGGEIETGVGTGLDLGAFAAETGIRWMPKALTDHDAVFGFTTTWLEGDDPGEQGDYRRYIQIADDRVYGEIADFYSGLISNDLADIFYLGVFVFNLDAQASFDALMLALEAYYFLAQEDVVNRLGLNSGEKNIGWEVDLYGEYHLTEHLDAVGATGFFRPGDAAKEWSGGGDDTAWFISGGLKVSF